MTEVGEESGSAGSPGFERSKRRGDGILAASFKRAASTMCSMTSEADAAITKSSTQTSLANFTLANFTF